MLSFVVIAVGRCRHGDDQIQKPLMDRHFEGSFRWRMCLSFSRFIIGAKPLPEPIMTCQIDPQEQNSVKFELKSKSLLPRRYPWRHRLQNICYFFRPQCVKVCFLTCPPEGQPPSSPTWNPPLWQTGWGRPSDFVHIRDPTAKGHLSDVTWASWFISSANWLFVQ